MSIKTRKFKCTGCGEDRSCTLETKQEPHSYSKMDDLFTEDLKCVLDSTNQTSYNWKEVFDDVIKSVKLRDRIYNKHTNRSI